MAARMLLVWLAVLATSIVNACVVAPHLHAASADGHDTGHQEVGAQQPFRFEVADEDDPPWSNETACVKFCSDESAGAPSVKQKTDLWPSVGLAPRLTATRVLRPADALLHLATQCVPLRAGVPVPIAFLRLAL
jgi:hypothetical protein